MKDFYKINELAKLFSLHPDTLRYYEEKGLLRPVRGENNYRTYGIQDICTLNIIRSLRDLGMPISAIRDYLESRTVDATLDFIDEEQSLLRRRMDELEEARRESECRRQQLLHYAAAEAGVVTVKAQPERPYVFLREDVIFEGEIDFLLKKLEKKHQDYIKIIGNQCMGAVLDGEYLKKGVYNHYSRVFFLTEPEKPHDAALPAGQYASLYYRGTYTAFERHFQTLLAGINAKKLSPAGLPLELYRIDAHDTNLEDEYLTEIQVRVEPLEP
ncbi:MAG: MerR family transcriptional regulator [Clostridia bacterium]|nr:MerR family transcriptional regulator [Clostridia bacterium]